MPVRDKRARDKRARDKRTRAERYEELEADLAYTAQELDRSVVVPNQIRTALEAYRDGLITEPFPGRGRVPKTLIFCKDDHHAEEVVGIVREVGLSNMSGSRNTSPTVFYSCSSRWMTSGRGWSPRA